MSQRPGVKTLLEMLGKQKPNPSTDSNTLQRCFSSCAVPHKHLNIEGHALTLIIQDGKVSSEVKGLHLRKQCESQLFFHFIAGS